jgi:hypothetical protein
MLDLWSAGEGVGAEEEFGAMQTLGLWRERVDRAGDLMSVTKVREVSVAEPEVVSAVVLRSSINAGVEENGAGGSDHRRAAVVYEHEEAGSVPVNSCSGGVDAVAAESHVAPASGGGSSAVRPKRLLSRYHGEESMESSSGGLCGSIADGAVKTTEEQQEFALFVEVSQSHEAMRNETEPWCCLETEMPVKLSRVKVRKGYCVQKLGELNYWCVETHKRLIRVAESVPSTSTEGSDRAGALLGLCDVQVEGIGDTGKVSSAVRIAACLDRRPTRNTLEKLRIRMEANSIVIRNSELDWGGGAGCSLSLPDMEISGWKADSMAMCAVAEESKQLWPALMENKEPVGTCNEFHCGADGGVLSL